MDLLKVITPIFARFGLEKDRRAAVKEFDAEAVSSSIAVVEIALDVVKSNLATK